MTGVATKTKRAPATDGKVVDTETMLKPKEVATWLGVHVHTVKRLSDRGEILFYRVGTRGDRRYRPVDVVKYLERRTAQNGNRR